MSEYFTYDGVDSRTFSAVCFEKNTFGAPARVYDAQDIPGRSGILLMDGKKYPNVSHEYTCVIYETMTGNLQNFRNFLVNTVGYKRLEDSMHPDEYYMAAYRSAVVAVMDDRRQMCKLDVVFDRKPQRFLKSGETVTTLTANGTITNPERTSARPLLRLYGTGTITIGHYAIQIISAEEYTDIDCEMMEAYKGTASCNGRIRVIDHTFPVLAPGANNIVLNGITRVDITPRWWRL